MSKIRRITVSQIEGNDANADNDVEIRPFGEVGFFVNEDGNSDKLELLMFDGVRTHLKSKVLGNGILYGSNADSGDGAGLDTIKLIPDAALYRNDGLYGNDQYLIVDPTFPNHIHIRAGGTQDNSNAALFLGGENSHVEVQAGENPPVYVRSNNNTWMFDVDGGLEFPDSSKQITAWGGGRVVNVPTGSTGNLGDRQGDLAFDDLHLYYCSANYSAVSWDNTAIVDVLGGDGVVSGIAIRLDVVPSVGWAISDGVTTSTINQVVPQGDWYVIFWDDLILFDIGDTVYYGATAPIQENIWKRIAWGVDTW